MQETENFKLKKPDYTDFADIVEDLSENFDIVDAALKHHADALIEAKKTWSVELPAAGWSASFPYMQTVAAPDMKADYSPIWGILNSESTEARAKQVAKVQLKSITTQDGSVRVVCMKRPAVDIRLHGEGV